MSVSDHIGAAPRAGRPSATAGWGVFARAGSRGPAPPGTGVVVRGPIRLAPLGGSAGGVASYRLLSAGPPLAKGSAG